MEDSQLTFDLPPVLGQRLAQMKREEVAMIRDRVKQIKTEFMAPMPHQDIEDLLADHQLSRILDAKITCTVVRQISYRHQHLQAYICEHYVGWSRRGQTLSVAEIDRIFLDAQETTKKMAAHYNQNIYREIGLIFFHMSHHLLTKSLGLHPLLDLDTAEDFMSDMHRTERKSGIRWNQVAAQLREALDRQVVGEVGEDIICNELLVKRSNEMIASKLADNYWTTLAHAEEQVLELCATKPGITFMEILDAHTKAFKDRDRDTFQVVKRITKKYRETAIMFRHASNTAAESRNVKLANELNEKDVTVNNRPSTHNLKIFNTLIDRLCKMRKEEGLKALATTCAKSTTIGILVAWEIDSIYIEEERLAASLEKIQLLHQIGHQRIIQHCKEKVQVFSEERSRGGETVTCAQLVQYTIQACKDIGRQTARDDRRIHSDIVLGGLGWSKATKSQDRSHSP